MPDYLLSCTSSTAEKARTLQTLMLLARCARRASTSQRYACSYYDAWINSEYSEALTSKDGSEQILFTTGQMARFCNGSVVVDCEGSKLLVTASSTESPSGKFQMSVDCLRPASEIARLPSALRPQLQAGDKEVAITRLIDRSIRPIMCSTHNSYVKLMCKPIAAPIDADLRIMGINGAAAALALADTTLRANFGACRVTKIDGEMIVNSTRQLKDALVDVIVSGTDTRKIVMLDLQGRQVSSEDVVECVDRAMQEIERVTATIKRLRRQLGKGDATVEPEPGSPYEFGKRDYDLLQRVLKACETKLEVILDDSQLSKVERDRLISKLLKHVVDELNATSSYSRINTVYIAAINHIMRRRYRQSERRVDGRTFDESRPISITTNISPHLHGSAIFQRGQTQVLATASIDTWRQSTRSSNKTVVADSLLQLLEEHDKPFSLYYEFPALALNIVGQQSVFFERRSIGHGLLAERALAPLIPKDLDRRVTVACQVLESNGSSSMSSVAAASLALADAGVPIDAPCGGVALGIVHESGDDYRLDDTDDQQPIILVDQMGMEDFHFDADVKVAGTKRGFTAIQLELSVAGISATLLARCLQKARLGLDHVLQRMVAALPTPRANFKPSVPFQASARLSIAQQSRLRANDRLDAFLQRPNVKTREELDGAITIFVFSEDDAHALDELQKPRIEPSTSIDQTDDVVDWWQGSIRFDWGKIYRRARVVAVYSDRLEVILNTTSSERVPITIEDAMTQQSISTSNFEVGQIIDLQYLREDSVTQTHRFRLFKAV